MKFQRRAEGNDARKLLETFVDVGPLMTLLSSTDHQVVYGRRGTGKTHALSYLAEQRREKHGEIPIYIDLRTIGSSAGIYNDSTLPLAERATPLLADVLSEVHDRLMQYGLEQLAPDRQNPAGSALDKLAEAASRVRVVGTYEEEESQGEDATKKGGGGLAVSVGTATGLSGRFGKESEKIVRTARTIKRTGDVRHSINFGATMDALTLIHNVYGQRRIWLLLDEWSAVDLELQPILADLIRRAVLPIKGITVKIAAIEQRSQFKLAGERGAYLGIELGADMSADVNLDDFMVFDVEQNRAREFFRTLLYKHYLAVVPAGAAPSSAATLIQNAFTQVDMFDEFVRASEGVPRDAINILSLCAQRALDGRIAVTHLRTAARDWYQRDKENAVNQRAKDLLNWIIDEVIGGKRARAFLLRSGVAHRVIDDLFDARVLHILKRNISSKDEPGVRYDVYKLDYGCYVELANTQRAPIGLLKVDEAADAAYVDVPPDDYRSIRTAILDLAAFDAKHSAGKMVTQRF